MAGKGRPPKNKSEVVADEQPTKLSKKEQKVNKNLTPEVDERLQNLLRTTLKGSEILGDTKDKYTVKEWFDTGSLTLNLLISGDMYKGVPDNRVSQFVGDQSTAKTYITKKIMADAIKKGWTIFNINTEGDVELSEYERSGLNTKKIVMVRNIDGSIISNAFEVKHSVLKIIEDSNGSDKWLINIDSIGNLASKKEMMDAIAGKDVADMTRAKDLKSLFRTTLAKAFDKRIPITLINHEYDSQGFIPQKIISGGKGGRLAATVTLEFTKSQLKKDKDSPVIGAIIRVKAVKNRIAIEGKTIIFWIFFKGGILRHSGLDDLMCEYGIAKRIIINKKKGLEIEGEQYSLSALLSDPVLYDELIKKHNINEKFKELFSYKNDDETSTDINAELDAEEISVDNSSITDGESKDE